MQFNNPTSTKNETKKHDTSTLKKIDWPVASATRFASHPTRARCFASSQRTGLVAQRRRQPKMLMVEEPGLTTSRSQRQAGGGHQSPLAFIYLLDDGTADDAIGPTAGGDDIALKLQTHVLLFGNGLLDHQILSMCSSIFS